MTQLAIEDGDELSRTLRVIASGGLASGIVAALLVAIAGGQTAALTGLSFGGITGVAATFAQPADEETPLLSVILGLGGGAILALGFPTPLVAACLAGAAIGLGISVPESFAQGVRTALGSAGAFGAAVFTTGVLFENGFLTALDIGGVREPLTGVIWGTFMAAGVGLELLRLHGDRLQARLDAAIDDVGERAARFVRPARELYGEIRREIESADAAPVRDDAERILEESLRALESLARRGDELRGALDAHSVGDLEARRTAVQTQLEATDEETLRRELEAAREELARQASDRDRLETAIARIDVRQQRCLSALQRLHVHLVEDRDTAETESHLERSMEELSHLTAKVQWRNLSVEEICDRQLRGAPEGANGEPRAAGEAETSVDGDLDAEDGIGDAGSDEFGRGDSETDGGSIERDRATRRTAHALDGE